MKVYVNVIALCRNDGKLFPVAVVWEDGSRYRIDRVMDAKNQSSTRAGGNGRVYTCMIEGRLVHLYFENENRRWYLERKTA